MLNLIAKKIGMSHIYSESGTLTALTMLKVYDSCFVNIVKSNNPTFDNLIVGYGKTDRVKKVNKSVSGLFLKNNLPVHKAVYSCKIEKDADEKYKTGQAVDVAGLVAEGDIVDVQGITSGKGFAGVMKRHNFRGLEATHGVSISHRSHGSTGQRQDPGKVFKGKKMAGHMGVDKVTVRNLKVMFVDTENSIIAVKGCVPGRKNKDVILKLSGK